jgi:hypothetical protein
MSSSPPLPLPAMVHTSISLPLGSPSLLWWIHWSAHPYKRPNHLPASTSSCCSSPIKPPRSGLLLPHLILTSIFLPSRWGTQPQWASKIAVVDHRCRPISTTHDRLLSSVSTAHTFSFSSCSYGEHPSPIEVMCPSPVSSATIVPPGPRWTVGWDQPVVHSISWARLTTSQLKNNPKTS